MAQSKTLHEKLTEMSRNFWWSWQPEITNIFRQIDPERWTQLGHNPVLLLDEYTPEKLEKLANVAVLHSRINLAYRMWREYMESDQTWGATHTGILGRRPVAYFSDEFGIHE
ncbi:MAG: DUF3417 domain-containing protein [Planctomycetaceae bacterium]